MSAGAYEQSSSRLWGVVTVVLLAAGTAVAWWGTRSGVPSAVPTPPAAAETGPVHAIVLPADEPDLPPGPHREHVQVACTLCHSTRLALTQPRLTVKQWEAVVHKMAAVYGAPLTAEEEKEIVAYFESIR
jgi:hypothetical protein